uniref:(California timema) hypothetical protein n=1 Tax=Timema californicum TaxID=61474 RepID=A0A7R9J5M9_TIMCA|nr:unnamed protein product [Timema californicum]
MASLQDDMIVLELNKDLARSESDSSDDNDIDIKCNNDNEDPEFFDTSDGDLENNLYGGSDCAAAMSAGSQIQMAPQGNLNSGQPVHSQDSNMSTGSSHSDKEVDPNTPEKVPRTPSERKRKRKADDSGGVVALVPGGKGPRTADNKKINDYFNKHAGTSPIRHGGSKSPSPQQGYPMFPPSPQQTLLPSPVTPVTSVPPEFSSLMHLPRPLPVMASKLVQTELTCQRIQEFETQASSDLELRNNKIDELNRAKAIVEHYSRSPSTRKRLHTVMEEMVLPVLELIQFVDTRWSSEYNMLSRLHAVRKAVGAELANSENNIEILTEVEWKQAAGIVEVLGPLADATKEISGDNKALKSRFSFYDSDPIFCPSMLCDPRFRGVLIDDMVAVNTLAIEVKKLSDKSSLEPNVKDEHPSCSSSSSGLWSSFDSIPNTTQPAIDNNSEVKDYLNEPRTTEELRHQLTAQQKVIDQHKLHINKCIDVVKKLLKEKSNIEKKEARQKCMQNRLRLGQFVTQRVGATFQENWTDGYAFQELARRQEEITSEREEIDRQKKMLLKKRPSNSETGRKRNTGQQSQGSTTTTAILHNGTDATFLKPDPVPGFSWQEYYEADEILKLGLLISQKRSLSEHNRQSASIFSSFIWIDPERVIFIKTEFSRLFWNQQKRYKRDVLMRDYFISPCS